MYYCHGQNRLFCVKIMPIQSLDRGKKSIEDCDNSSLRGALGGVGGGGGAQALKTA